MTRGRKACRHGDRCEPRSIAEAIYCCAHHSDLDLETIAARMGCRPGYLRDASNPDREDTQFQSRHLIALMTLTKNFAPLRFLATECGHTAIQLPELQQAKDADVDREFRAAVIELGESSKLLQTAYEDHVLTEDEGRLLADEADQLIAVVLRYKAAVLLRVGITGKDVAASQLRRA